MTIFKKEADFEQAFVDLLTQKGWSKEILTHPTEADLLQNWADILFKNNRQQDRLNDVPLTTSEMQLIIEQITELKTPLKLNGFINGKSVAIKRDNPADKLHLGKEVSLTIFNRRQIAAGPSSYQIVRQPRFKRASPLRNDRRGDVMLLINGMPVIHVELKRSGTHVSQAVEQIEKYVKEGIFTGLFSLVQIFAAITPQETKYFANPGIDGQFNPSYQFHWADVNNVPQNNWKDIASYLLSIPMAHQLIGDYTIADNADGVLKVMRSYQYHAALAISDTVSNINWQTISSNADRLGGHIWHTTGSGKTMTSFKSAQLIAQSKDADKVVFLMDRIELGTQSLGEYRNFAGDDEEIQATENTSVLITKLKSKIPSETLIVSSIQKMSNISEDVNNKNTAINSDDIDKIRSKRLVFIVDEAHRSTFGDMLITIKSTFPNALFFGFTGTPIQEENKKKDNTTTSVFGNELHRYTITDGITDGNVLGFDPYKIETFKANDVRKAVALAQAKANSVEEALGDETKKKKFNYFMNDVPMSGHKNSDGNYIKGIEDHIPKEQYLSKEHQQQVVNNILEHWNVRSQQNMFHSILATSSIAEAIDYYRLIKAASPSLKITALFDPHLENDGSAGRGATFKADGLDEIMADYNTTFGQNFDFAKHDKFKRDIASRLAHKQPYERIHLTPAKQLDLLIVVDQMLTGFDSKWVNTLYLDKVIEYQNIIQAFSRTNRLFDQDKPHGTICYYRKPHTMERNIEAALKLYSGDIPIGLFVDKLEKNIDKLNHIFKEIQTEFADAGITDFEKLPEDKEVCAKFAGLFKDFNSHLEAAKVQGFDWSKDAYLFGDDNKRQATIDIDEQTYLGLVLRYKELAGQSEKNPNVGEVPYDLVGYITQIDTGKINADYMNSRFDKYLKELNKGQNPEEIEKTRNDLHKSFSSLTQIEQKYAKLFLNELQRGDAQLTEGKSFRDYINDYQDRAENARINAVVEGLGLNKELLLELLVTKVNEQNLNSYGRFDKLKATVDKNKAKAHLETLDGISYSAFKLNARIRKYLKEFILQQTPETFDDENSDNLLADNNLKNN